MTVEELVKWCEKEGVSLQTPIAFRSKDDYYIRAEDLYMGKPYFGNSQHGEEWINNNVPRDADGDTDYEKIPDFIIVDKDYA